MAPPDRPSTDVLPGSAPVHIPLKLQVVSGPDFGRELVLGPGRFTVGKDAACDLKLEDSSVSRVHLLLEALPSSVRVTDNDSTNGSLFNGTRFRTVELTPGAVVTVGRTELRVVVRASPLPPLAPSTQERFGELHGQSLVMRELFARLERVAKLDADVLLLGETGTGKELCARALHTASPRKGEPFVVCDVGTLSASLLDSELFGHMRGSFTGATQDRLGVFERAQGGTVFLDEVGEASLDVQQRLLRVLERREVKRLGASEYRPVNVRVIAATHRELEQDVEQGRFREDLYFRLAGLQLRVPPLRERSADVPLLIDDLLAALDKPRELVSASTRSLLVAYAWPGNVRELRSVVERAVHLGELPEMELASPTRPTNPKAPFKEAKESLVNAFERDYLVTLMERCGGNISRAAREAQLDRVYVRKLLRKHDLIPTDADADEDG